MSKICPLFSGSTGNSTYIGTESGGILIDAGASFKGINQAIKSIGEDINGIKAVAITHTHDDHIKGLRPLLKNIDAILIATKPTIEFLASANKIPENTKIKVIEDEMEFMNTNIKSFATSHDCEGSCGYTFEIDARNKISVCTDLGIITDDVRKAITGSNAIILESNHDIGMLKSGPYPPHLKIRILSDVGHLSNNVCSEEIKKLFKNGTTRFILGHLSKENNTPLLALSCAEAALMDLGAKNGRDCILSVAAPKNNGVTII